MSYYEDYGSSRSKIPYDDVPITRNERVARNSGYSRSGSRKQRTAPSFLVSFVLILNLFLSVVCFVLINTKKYRTINNYVLELGSSSEVSMAVKSSAITSTVCVTSTSSQGTSAGSGVIYRVDRNSKNSNKGTIYFVTCYHVVDNYQKNETKNIKVQPSSYSSSDYLKVSLAGYSSVYDIAVLKYESDDLDEDLWGCNQATIFDSSYCTQGEQIFAVGNPLGLGITITDGLISQLNSLVSIESNSEPSRCLQISAEINPGNSGGGLFNANGELIGIVNAKRDEASSSSGTITVEGTSYAIPISVVRGIANQIISGASEVQYLNLNVTFSNSSKKTIEPVPYNGGTKLIDSYVVKVSAVGKGIASNKLLKNDVITKIVYYDVQTGKQTTQIMFNQYSFEDCVFSIKKNTIVQFYLEGKKDPVEILASSFNSV